MIDHPVCLCWHGGMQQAALRAVIRQNLGLENGRS